ncbi:Uncharacterized protein TCM_025189 [Theobroma cacao]|uniref:Uncharacterized protein n=1 Tax=Theobroma cacao TaxID=3641 RepID=A0A061EXL2_THECC|nr:Uncharacterized protein TCM_025189 [Theobroma cacao]
MRRHLRRLSRARRDLQKLLPVFLQKMQNLQQHLRRQMGRRVVTQQHLTHQRKLGNLLLRVPSPAANFLVD